MHAPVMPDQAIEYLAVKRGGTYLDATAGLGGHTALIARRLETGRLIAADRDAESLDQARRATSGFSARMEFVQVRFSGLREALDRLGVDRVDGLLADLGASRYQLTDPQRGFSFQSDGPLDMRMDRSHGMTAAELVNHTAEQALADLIYRFGEERRARQIARAIVRTRPIRTTAQLAGVVESVARRTGRLHPATRTFMALRLAVNEEQEELDALLDAVPRLVASGGRVVAIAFMSLEDRKVKHSFQDLARRSQARILTRHVVRPTVDEVRRNPAARSARLRAVEMG